MTDIAVIAATAEAALLEVATQASGLARGLQNIAPSDRVTSSNNTINYLEEISQVLTHIAQEAKKVSALKE